MYLYVGAIRVSKWLRFPKQTNKQTSKHANEQTSKQANKQTSKHTNIQTRQNKNKKKPFYLQVITTILHHLTERADGTFKPTFSKTVRNERFIKKYCRHHLPLPYQWFPFSAVLFIGGAFTATAISIIISSLISVNELSSRNRHEEKEQNKPTTCSSSDRFADGSYYRWQIICWNNTYGDTKKKLIDDGIGDCLTLDMKYGTWFVVCNREIHDESCSTFNHRLLVGDNFYHYFIIFFFLHNWILKFFCLKNRLGDFLKSIWVLFETSRFLSCSSIRLETKSCRDS